MVNSYLYLFNFIWLPDMTVSACENVAYVCVLCVCYPYISLHIHDIGKFCIALILKVLLGNAIRSWASWFIIFQDLYQIDEVASEYQALIIAVNHSFVNETSFVSVIRLRVEEIKKKIYRCEFVLKDYSICDSITEISFKGALLPALAQHLNKRIDKNKPSAVNMSVSYNIYSDQ